MSGVVEESLSPGEAFSDNDSNRQSNSACARIIRRCSGPETAFNNISNNGGATIGCVIEIDTGRPLTCKEVFSVIENLYNKYEILRLRFIFKQKILYWREASRDETFCVNEVECVHDKTKFAEDFMCGDLCRFYPHGSALWTIKFCPYVAKDDESAIVLQQGAGADATVTGVGDVKTEAYKSQLKYSTFLIGFRCNHGFLDGVGALSLMQDMGKMISDYVMNEEMPSFEPVSLSPPYEELVPEAKFVWALRQMASVGIRFVETFANLKKSLPNYYPVRNMLKLEKFKPKAWNREQQLGDSHGIGFQYIILEEKYLELFQRFRRMHKLSFSGLLMSLLSVGLMKYAFKGYEWPKKLLAFDTLRDTRMYFKDSYSNRTKYITNYIGATMPILFLAAAFNGRRVKDKQKGGGSNGKEKQNSHKSSRSRRHSQGASNLNSETQNQNNHHSQNPRRSNSHCSPPSTAGPGAGEVWCNSASPYIADRLAEYVKTQSIVITNIIRKRSASMVTLKSVAYYLQAFADPVKAKRLFSLIKSKDSSEGRSSFAGFSNLGRVDSYPNNLEMKSLVAAIDISRFIYCINFIVVTVKNDVHITMSYPHSLYTREQMQELQAAVTEVILLVLNRYAEVSSNSSAGVAGTSSNGWCPSKVVPSAAAATGGADIDKSTSDLNIDDYFQGLPSASTVDGATVTTQGLISNSDGCANKDREESEGGHKRLVCVTTSGDHDLAEGVSLPGQISGPQPQPRRSSTPWADANRISMPVDDSDDIDFA